ncbi:unnamed protein product [Somion occarium]|uniref:DUF2235 domain-containing protein n=1 Tax=Somion occarium TaxID=3059160 RepID=A0ABP1DK33_9APHY
MDGLLSDPSNEPYDGGSQQVPTNVTRLSRAIAPLRVVGNDTISQITFYQSGTGSLAGFDGQGIAEDKTLQAYGIAVASKIRDAYCFIAQNYAPGDEICLFGFSRGAYTARKVAGLINRIGLLGREELSKFFTYWLQLSNGEQPGPPWPDTPIPIKCVGVWDTVGSVMSRTFSPIIDALSIKDTSLPPNIEVALHAVSLQENRKPFMCTLWTVPEGGLAPNQILKQRWFSGAHSDVGGGYANSELADLSLFWMASEISSFVTVDLPFIEASRQRSPSAHWGQHQPHNAWNESGATKHLLGHESRLEGKQVDKDSDFHLSIGEAPIKLTDPKYMITLDDLKRTLGSGWTPIYMQLSSFEQACRNNWDKPVLRGPREVPVGLDTPVGFIARAAKRQTANDTVVDQGAISPVPPLTLRIRNVLSGMMLDLSGGIHGGLVVNNQPNDQESQKAVGNNFTIRNANTNGAYLGTPPNVAPASGNKVHADQAIEWQIKEVSGGQAIELAIANDPNNLVLDLYGSFVANGTPIIFYPEGGGLNQQWILEDVLLHYRGDVAPGTYVIRNYSSRKALNLNVHTGEIVNYQYNGGDGQKWIVQAVYGGCRIMSYNKPDVYVGFREPGVPFHGTHAFGGNLVAEWHIQKAGDDLYNIELVSDPNLVLDLYYNNPENDTPIIAWPKQTPGHNQKWYFDPVA